jgi:hypothetical protein
MKEGKDVEVMEAYFKILSWHSPRQGSQENIFHNSRSPGLKHGTSTVINKSTANIQSYDKEVLSRRWTINSCIVLDASSNPFFSTYHQILRYFPCCFQTSLWYMTPSMFCAHALAHAHTHTHTHASGGYLHSKTEMPC